MKTYSGSCDVLLDGLNGRLENEDIEQEEKFLEQEMNTECDHVIKPPRSVSLAFLQRTQLVCI